MQKRSRTDITVIPPHVSKEAGQIVHTNEVNSLSFWRKMPPAKQEALREEIRQLVAARITHVMSGLTMGKHIQAIYDTCEPYSGAFRKLMASFKFSERTAYRYMESYENAATVFPENILKVVMARGMNILSHSKEAPLGRYTEVVKLLPPPRNPDVAEATRYVDQLEKTYQERRRALAAKGGKDTAPMAIIRDKEELLKANYRGIRNALKALPTRQKRPFLDALFGMALTEAGISSKTYFEPEAIPEEFRQGPGRPRLEAEEAAA